MFNITNMATFENIIFTGEDLFANATYNGKPFGYMGNYGLLATLPVTKCKVEDDLENIGPIDELKIKPMTFVPMDGVNYECVNPFKQKDVMPPDKVDDRCFTPEYNVSPISGTCSGDPYHSDFFSSYSKKNQAYLKRHKTLFNLYAFDRLRTANQQAPTLTIKNCEFKFFVNTMNSLIQVENNNLGYIGDPPANGQPDERFLTYYGEDRGAKITIINSTFTSNSFCKGLIYYNRF